MIFKMAGNFFWFVIFAKDDNFPEIWRFLLPCSNGKAFENSKEQFAIIVGRIKVSKT